MSYNGYLLPYVSLIKQLTSEGMTQIQISRHLYENEGARPICGSHSGRDDDNIISMAGTVAYVIRVNKPKPQSRKVTRTTLAWQTWTPEMQEAEFQMGYSR